jgi:hypothetical protein
MSPEHDDARIFWEGRGQKTQEGPLPRKRKARPATVENPEVPAGFSFEESEKACGGMSAPKGR